MRAPGKYNCFCLIDDWINFSVSFIVQIDTQIILHHPPLK